MTNRPATLLGLLLAAAIVPGAHAEDLRSERTVALDLSNEIMAASVAACVRNGYQVTAVVVGAIGVSGAPGGELDSACAEAGMKLLAGRV